ncbi:inositol monophosphatase, partial [Candidatus Parcubacteria bacterium]
MTQKFLQVAQQAAQSAGQILLKQYSHFDRHSIKLKSVHEILTQADLFSERTIIKIIKRHFPGHSILSEETGGEQHSSPYLWVIDPIDGTTNFSIHNPLWSVSIALAHKQPGAKNYTIQLGVIFAPALKELFVAQVNKGAKLNGRPIKVSRGIKSKAIHTFCHGSSHADIKRALRYLRHQKLNGLDCRQLGSAALELAYVASGRVESFVVPGTRPW